VATGCIIADKKAGPASSHGATILAFDTDPNYGISIIHVVNLTSLRWDIVAKAPAGVVSIATLCIETWTLWLAIVMPRCGKGFEQFVILHTLASIRACKELLGARNRVKEGVWRQTVVCSADAKLHSVNSD